MRFRSAGSGSALLVLLLATPGFAQDIEPRRWTPLPVGLNILGTAIAHTEGDIALDPTLELENVTVESNVATLSYLRSFKLLNQSARFDALVPFQEARWEGLLSGQPASTERQGVGDPRLRLSINFLGAPALEGEVFRRFQASHPINTVVGAALAITLPLGEYKQDKILNLGGNRYVIRPQLGFVHTRGHWSYELTGSIFLYSDNNDFLGDKKLEQDSLSALQTHLTYASQRRWWVSVSAAYDQGGESRVNGVKKGDEKQELLFGISSGFSITPSSSMKLVYVGSRTQENTGLDTDSVIFSYLVSF